MSLRSSRLKTLLILVGTFLALRYVWTLATSPAGRELHWNQWTTAALRLAGLPATVPLAQQDPDVQASVWLQEAAQIPSIRTDPQVALGAAWMLDAPDHAFLVQHLRRRQETTFTGERVPTPMELDNDAVLILRDRFESLCHAECLRLAEQATRLDAGNPDVWRGRALLLFRPFSGSRSKDWQTVLAECAAHDPGNALYDYLAACELWSQAREDDPTSYRPGNERFAAGLTKPYLRFGETHRAAMGAFLAETRIKHADRRTAVERRETRELTVVAQLIRGWQASLDLKSGRDREAALTAYRQMLHVSEQMGVDGDEPGARFARLILRRSALAGLHAEYRNRPALADREDAAAVARRLDATQIEVKVWSEVQKRWSASRTTTWISALAPAGLTFSMQVVLVGAGLGLAFGSVSVLFGGWRDASVTFGWLRHVAAWLIGGAFSFALFGLCPAGFFSEIGQTWIPPVDLWSSPAFSYEEVRDVLRLKATWTFAFLQWEARRGLLASGVIAGCVVLVWQFLRDVRARGAAATERCGWRRLGGRACLVGARSSLAAAAAACLVVIWTMPFVVSADDAEYAARVARLTNPSLARAELAAAQASVESDRDLMSRLRGEVRKHNRAVARQEGGPEP